MTFFWAWVAGTLTLINPCVLPLLPVVIASALNRHRLGPVMIALGLTISFTIVGVLVTAFGHSVGLSEHTVNRIAAGMMILFGLVLLVPSAYERMSSLATPIASRANQQLDSTDDKGLLGQFLVGVLLGAVWTPCVGPTLGGAISLARSSYHDCIWHWRIYRIVVPVLRCAGAVGKKKSGFNETNAMGQTYYGH